MVSGASGLTSGPQVDIATASKKNAGEDFETPNPSARCEANRRVFLAQTKKKRNLARARPTSLGRRTPKKVRSRQELAGCPEWVLLGLVQGEQLKKQGLEVKLTATRISAKISETAT